MDERTRRNLENEGIENSLEGKTDDLKGRLKDAVGGLTGDESLQAEGKIDRVKGQMKDKVGPIDFEIGNCGSAVVHKTDADTDDDEVRFALTSEAGLNDGLAFPFTNLAILIALTGVSPSGWLGEFLLIEIAYKVGVGLLGGVVVGRALAWAIFARYSPLPRIRDGMIALGATLVAYAGTEMVGGYGFLAVFVAAVTIRNQERDHEYQQVLHDFAEQTAYLITGERAEFVEAGLDNAVDDAGG